MQEQPTDQAASLLEETPVENPEENNDRSEEENMIDEAEEEASKNEPTEVENQVEEEKKSSDESEKVAEKKKDEINPISQPVAEKKVEKKETSSQAELLKSPDEKATEAKPVSEPASEPVSPPAPVSTPAPEPKPEVIPAAEPEVIVAPDVMVVLSDGTGKNYKSFMDGVAGTLNFKVTMVEHESVAENVIIEMTTPPGSYKEGSTVKILVSSGKPAPAVVETYPVTYLSDAETELVRLVNDYRLANGLNALEVRADLIKSARYKSKAMIEHNYFSHDNPQDGNVSFSGLMRNVFKYNHYSGMGENLAAQYGTSTQGSAEKFFLQWKNSDGHNKNMLDPSWKYMGIGVAYTSKAGSTFNNYAAALATQHFAR